MKYKIKTICLDGGPAVKDQENIKTWKRPKKVGLIYKSCAGLTLKVLSCEPADSGQE